VGVLNDHKQYSVVRVS